jgi:hypothetical protein
MKQRYCLQFPLAMCGEQTIELYESPFLIRKIAYEIIDNHFEVYGAICIIREDMCSEPMAIVFMGVKPTLYIKEDTDIITDIRSRMDGSKEDLDKVRADRGVDEQD